jgi:Fe-S oxidoreductase
MIPATWGVGPTSTTSRGACSQRPAGLCCGAGGGVKANYPSLAAQIARQRLAQVDNARLCTACPLCYAHLREYGEDVEVLELSQALARGKGSAK